MNPGYLAKGLDWLLDFSFSATTAGEGKAAVAGEVSDLNTEIDVSQGWVDPRILGGRLLDASKFFGVR